MTSPVKRPGIGEHGAKQRVTRPKIATPPFPVMAVSIMDLAAVPRPDTKFVVLHDGYVGLRIYPEGGEYPIEHARMKTNKAVLGWVYHISKKRTVTREHIRAFIEAAERIRKGTP